MSPVTTDRSCTRRRRSTREGRTRRGRPDPPRARVARGVGFFLIAAGIALAVAAFVGDRLGHRIVRPLEDAEAATRRIAEGDLATRIPTTERADAEMASLTSSINAMAENLDRAQGLERQFLLSVSHDLRTPLTSIRGFAEAIADGATDDNVRAAEVIAAEARRLERLVGDLLDLANLDARRFTFEPQPVDAAVIAADTADAFRPLLDDAGLVLVVTLDAAGTPPVARADPDRLAQVIANLVENAYAFASSRIEVIVEGDETEVTIVVIDDGPGIAVEEQAPRVRTPLPAAPHRRDCAAPHRVGARAGDRGRAGRRDGRQGAGVERRRSGGSRDGRHLVVVVRLNDVVEVSSGCGVVGTRRARRKVEGKPCGVVDGHRHRSVAHGTADPPAARCRWCRSSPDSPPRCGSGWRTA